jgi:hypothetical protein
MIKVSSPAERVDRMALGAIGTESSSAVIGVSGGRILGGVAAKAVGPDTCKIVVQLIPMACPAIRRGMRSKQGEAGVLVLLHHIRDQPRFRRMASITLFPQFSAVQVVVAIGTELAGSAECQRGMTGCAPNHGVLPPQGKSRRCM